MSGSRYSEAFPKVHWTGAIAAAIWIICLCLPAGAREACFEGITMKLPASWGSEEVSTGPGVKVRTQGSLVAAEDASTKVLAEKVIWAEDVPDGSFPTNFTLSILKEHTAVSPVGLERVRRQVERATANLRGMENVQVRDLEVVEVAGVPGYRLRVSLEKVAGGERVRVEQLHYVLGATTTMVFSFSAASERYASEEREFEEVMASVSSRGGVLAAMPPWFCGALLGCVASFSAAARRSRPRRPRAARRAQGFSAGGALPRMAESLTSKRSGE